MWDQITFTIPAAEESYAMIERIHAAVLKETDKAARLAEAEWKRSARHAGLSQFAADPAVKCALALPESTSLSAMSPGPRSALRYATGFTNASSSC